MAANRGGMQAWRDARRMGPPQPAQPVEVVDREKVCPLLLRVFPRQGGHHKVEEFADRSKLPGEIAIYTWLDADLRELAELVGEGHPAAASRSARVSFALVYPDRRGRNVMRQVGVVRVSRPGEDDSRSLRQLGFQIGDFLDVAIFA